MPIVDSPARRFIGANIKGTPAMPAASVEHDLRVLKGKTDVLAMQEFKWPWYWHVLGRVLRMVTEGGWRCVPSAVKGATQPIRSAQPIAWRRRLWRRLEAREQLLHNGAAGISDDRWIRGVLLRERSVVAAVLASWFVTWHNVVGGDGPHDGHVRKAILRHDNDVAEAFLTALVATGYPVVGELDGNMHKGTEQFRRFVQIVESLGGTFHGELGVEFLFTIPGSNGTSVLVDDEWTVPNAELRTDHEARGITFRLRRKVTRAA